MSHIFDIAYLIPAFGYTGIFLIVFLESGIFFALPGDSLLFSAGILASVGAISLLYVLIVVFFATFLGSIVGYYIGVYLQTLQKYAFFRKFITKDNIEKAHEFFEQHGKWTLVISRFVPIVRTFVPIVAGISKTDKEFFMKWNFVGSVLWTCIVTLLGYYLGITFPAIKEYTQYFIILVVLISLLPLFLRKWQKKPHTK